MAGSLATLPFSVLRRLYDTTPLSTDDGVLLRRMTLEVGCLHLVLACLSVLSHHTPRGGHPEVSTKRKVDRNNVTSYGKLVRVVVIIILIIIVIVL